MLAAATHLTHIHQQPLTMRMPIPRLQALAALLLCICVQRTLARQPVLFYVPFYVSEATERLDEFAECLCKYDIGKHVPGFDVLIALNGPESINNEADIQKQVSSKLHNCGKPVDVFVEFVTLENDNYEKGSTKQRSTDWVSGPNTVFYGAMYNGTVFEQYTRHYQYIFQLESDVCFLRDGWLDTLLEPMLKNEKLIVVGTTIKGDCVHNPKFNVCEPATAHPVFIQQHINGNALYRIGPGLAGLLKHARTVFDKWPFDLAMFLSAQQLESLVRAQRFRACLVWIFNGVLSRL